MYFQSFGTFHSALARNAIFGNCGILDLYFGRKQLSSLNYMANVSKSLQNTTSSEDSLPVLVHEFFAQRFSRAKKLKLILGISGGSDSTALWRVMHEISEKLQIELTCVHINHHWRPESSAEAQELQKQLSACGLHLQIFELNRSEFSGNLEAHCRLKRLEIFTKIARECKATALVLAHQSDDRIEGALKRFFEGSEIAQLHSAPLADVTVGNLRVLRPLLSVNKGQITAWLHKQKAPFFIDRSNADPKLWRGFVRSWLIPNVERALKKEIDKSLNRVLEYSREIDDLLDLWLTREQGLAISRGFAGVWLTLPAELPPIVLRHLLKKIAAGFCSSLPHSCAERVVEAVKKGNSNCKVQFGNSQFINCQVGVFFVSNPLFATESTPQIIDKCGDFSLGIWSVQAQKIASEAPAHPTSLMWTDIWRGDFQVAVPGATCTLTLSTRGLRASGSQQTLFERWGKLKVPAFLRPWIPIVITDTGRICDWICKRPERGGEIQSLSSGWTLSFRAKKGSMALRV